MIKNSILLCTFNEGKYIKDTILSLKKNIPDLEIIIVDDNSFDETISVISSLNTIDNLKVIQRKRTNGLGSAFQRALIESKGENIGWIDANMGNLANMFPKMIIELDNHDLVLLSRYVDGGSDERSLLRVFCSKLINFFCRFILSNKIKDYTSSIFIMKRSTLNETVLLGYGHGDFFIEFLYSVVQKKLSIKEIPYKQKKDHAESSSNTAPNLARFFILGFFYFTRILITKFRRN